MSTETAKPSGRFTTGLKRFLFGSGQTLESIFASRSNGLNLVRLFLATGVLFSHSFPLLGQHLTNLPAPLERLLSGGTMVDGFFVISGFLIFRSAASGIGTLDYFLRRIFRIFPALLVCLVFISCLLAPIMAWHEQITFLPQHSLTFVVRNIFLYPLQGGVGFTLANVPYKTVWNGSLWTLPWEFLAYIVLWGFVRISRGSKTVLFTYLFLAWAGTIAIARLHLWVPLHDLHLNWLTYGTRLGTMFGVGVLLSTYAHRIKINKFMLLASATASLACFYTETSYRALGPFAFGLLLLSIGCYLRLPSFLSKNDFSYGMYIFSFPVQQSLVGFGLNLATPWLFAIQTFALTTALAAASWFFIEKPALKVVKPKVLEFLSHRLASKREANPNL